MLKAIQLFIAILTACDAFQGSFYKATIKSSSLRMAIDDNENNVPRLARDSMMQPMQRGKGVAFCCGITLQDVDTSWLDNSYHE